VRERTARKQRANSGKGNRIGSGSGLIRGAIVINPAYAVTQMCQIISASTQRRSFKAAAKGFFPDYMVFFRDKPVDVPRGPPPQRRINIYKCIRKSKDYGSSISDLRKKDSESGSKDERGRRNDKEAPIGDRDAFEMKKDL
jgi:hypothetical protein